MLKLGIAALLAAASAPTAAAAGDPYAAFGAFLESARKDSGTPALSAVILRDGQIVWEGYYGHSDDEAEFPTDADTTYSIASITKPIAAAGIIAESLAGQLSLDAPMTSDPGWARTCEWLSGSKIPFGGGGIDAHGDAIGKMDCARKTTIGQMLDMRANGDAFVYNPIAYARLDRAISGVGGRDLRAIVRDRVAEPAGMRNVALGWRDPEGGDALRLLAAPYRMTPEGPVKNSVSDDDFRAAAGIKASPRALAAFDKAFDEGVILPPKLVARISRGQSPGPRGDYRFGWFVEDWNGHRLMWHSGWDPDRYSAMYLKVPDEHLALIVLANTEMVWWDNSPIRAEIETSPIARRFLEDFVK